MIMISGTERDNNRGPHSKGSSLSQQNAKSVEETKEKIRAIFRSDEKIRATIKKQPKQ